MKSRLLQTRHLLIIALSVFIVSCNNNVGGIPPNTINPHAHLMYSHIEAGKLETSEAQNTTDEKNNSKTNDNDINEAVRLLANQFQGKIFI